jgi:cytochrome c peroxidase
LQAPFCKKFHFYDGTPALLWTEATVPALNPLESKGCRRRTWLRK